MKKRLLSILTLSLMLVSLFCISASAASKTVFSWSNVQTYATKTIKVFKNTKTNSSSGSIYNGDCITIKNYDSSSKRFNVTYPVTTGKNKGGTATGYIKASDVGSSLSYYPNKVWNVAYGFEVKGYTRSSKFNKSVTFSGGTEIYEFGSNGEYVSAVAKKGSSYLLIYIKKSDIRKKPSISSSKKYKIVSKLNSNYVLDVANGSKNGGANVQLYKWNGTAAQKFEFKGYSDGTLDIINCNSYLQLMNSNGNVEQWITSDGNWYVAEDNDGYVLFVDCSNKNLCMDVAGGKVGNGVNIQVYSANNSNAQRFKLVAVN